MNKYCLLRVLYCLITVEVEVQVEVKITDLIRAQRASATMGPQIHDVPTYMQQQHHHDVQSKHKHKRALRSSGDVNVYHETSDHRHHTRMIPPHTQDKNEDLPRSRQHDHMSRNRCGMGSMTSCLMSPSSALPTANSGVSLERPPRCRTLNAVGTESRANKSAPSSKRPLSNLVHSYDRAVHLRAKINRLSAQLSSLESLFPSEPTDDISLEGGQQEAVTRMANIGRKRDMGLRSEAGIGGDVDVVGVGSWSCVDGYSGYGVSGDGNESWKGARVRDGHGHDRVYGYKGY